MDTLTLVAADAQFYPTPNKLIGKMLARVDWLRVKNALEPSAGDGRIATAIRKAAKKNRYGSEIDVDCVEIDPQLQIMLLGQGHRLVCDDFLRYKPFVRYDLIVMNPPFAEGDKHLLHALDLLADGGQLVAICNAETLRNPFSRTRIELARRLETLDADVEYMPGAFTAGSGADRTAEVEIAMITAKKSERDEVGRSRIWDELEQAQRVEDEENCVDAVAVSDFPLCHIRAYQMEAKAGLALIREYRALAPYIMASDSQYASPLLELKCDGHTVSKGSDADRFLRILREKYWEILFKRTHFLDKCTEEMKREYSDRLREFYDVEFNEFNILKLATDINCRLADSVKENIMALFEKLSCEHSYFDGSANVHYYDGWKTNKAHKINNKVILPAYVRWEGSYSSHAGAVSAYSACGFLKDIELTLNYLDGHLTDDVDMSARLQRAEEEIQTRNIPLKYFSVTFYKKGTCHIKFHEEAKRLVEKLNIFAARERNWLPPSYGKKHYAQMDDEERAVVDAFQGQEAYEKVLAEADYYLGGANTTALLTA